MRGALSRRTPGDRPDDPEGCARLDGDDRFRQAQPILHAVTVDHRHRKIRISSALHLPSGAALRYSFSKLANFVLKYEGSMQKMFKSLH